MKETDVIRQFARTPEHDDKQYISTLSNLVVRLANEIDKLQDQINEIKNKVKYMEIKFNESNNQ